MEPSEGRDCRSCSCPGMPCTVCRDFFTAVQHSDELPALPLPCLPTTPTPFQDCTFAPGFNHCTCGNSGDFVACWNVEDCLTKLLRFHFYVWWMVLALKTYCVLYAVTACLYPPRAVDLPACLHAPGLLWRRLCIQEKPLRKACLASSYFSADSGSPTCSLELI